MGQYHIIPRYQSIYTRFVCLNPYFKFNKALLTNQNLIINMNTVIGYVYCALVYNTHLFYMIDWLIDWCLMPILAMLQLYHGVNKFHYELRSPLLYAKLVLLILTDSNSNDANIKSWFPLLCKWPLPIIKNKTCLVKNVL